MLVIDATCQPDSKALEIQAELWVVIEATAEVMFKMTYLTHIVASHGGLGMLRIAAMLWT